MARIERTYSQEKVKQMLKLNEDLPSPYHLTTGLAV